MACFDFTWNEGSGKEWGMLEHRKRKGEEEWDVLEYRGNGMDDCISIYIEKILSGKRGSPEDKIKKAGICCFEDSDFFLLKKLKKQIKAVYFLRRHRACTILPL